MFGKLIETKLHPPRSPGNLVRRHRLIDVLESSLKQDGVSVLISAPAGYGKTSLIVDWVSHSVARSAWLTLDKNDNDLTRFTQYIYAAIQRATGLEESTALSVIEAPVHPLEEDLAAAVASDFSSLQSKTVLLLDDYHKITNRSVHGIVSYLLQNLPPQLVVALLTREDPAFPLARLRTQDLLLEIRAKDLRFDTEESKAFIEGIGSVRLAESECSALAAKTEGWAAGLKLAALSLEHLNDQDSHRLMADFSGSNRYVIDYFGEEVLQNQSRKIIGFLPDTAHLTKLRADLCNAVTGRGDSEEIIQTLVQKNLFIAPIEGEDGWYRYHPLFADFLRIRFQSPRTAELHQKAAGWYAERRMYYEAMGHAEQISDKRMLKKILSEAALTLLEGGRYRNLLDWLKMLGDVPLLEDIRLTVYKGWALYFQNHADDAFDLVRKCESKGSSTRRSDLILLGSWLRSALGEPVGVDDLAECIESKKSMEPFFLLHAYFLHSKICLQSGDSTTALQSAEASRRLAEEYGNPFFIACAAHLQAYCLIERGKRHQAEKFCDRMIDTFGQESGGGQVFAGLLRIPASFVRYLANDIPGALSVLGEVQGDFNGLMITDYTVDDGSYVGALLSMASSSFEKAISTVVRKGSGSSMREMVSAVFALKNSDITAAADAIRIDMRECSPNGMSFTNFSAIVKLRVLLALGRTSDAESILQNMETAALQNDGLGSLLLINIFLSLAKHTSGETVLAREYMRKALDMAEPGNYRRPFLDEGRGAEVIIRDIDPVPHSFAASLLREFRTSAGDGPSSLQPYFEQISKRECEVIALMAKGMSNQEIADTLFISLGTVKWHVNNIFGKLDVKNRTSAINRALELNLISDRT